MKIGQHNFDSSWRSRCSVMECGRAPIDEIIRRYHYLRCWPGVTVKCFALLCDWKVVGACVYSLPPAESEKRYGGPTWELARLWIDDSIPKNAETWLIAKTIRAIEREHREIYCLVSYADPAAGHTGTIYRAANWQSDGRMDEERNTPRWDYYVGDKKYGRRSHIPEGATIEKKPRPSKFRFIYRLVGTAKENAGDCSGQEVFQFFIPAS